MGVLYVDDTDLYIMHEWTKSGYDIWDKAGEALNMWGNLLIATGGMLKLEKMLFLHGGLRLECRRLVAILLIS